MTVMHDGGLPATVGREWIVPSNTRTFDTEAAFAELRRIDWSESSNARIRVGDIVYLYTTSPVQALTHRCRVIDVGLTYEQIIDDAKFWVDRQALLNRETRSWMRLELLNAFDKVTRARLSREQLSRFGVSGNIQGRRTLTAAQAEQINDAWQTASDASAEVSRWNHDEESQFQRQVDAGDYAMPNVMVTTTTRGSAQRVFARRVKANYGGRCAVTGIRTPEFLVASHIVPWSADASIRLDPSNGICLSTLVDRAFDTGFLTIGTDLVVRIDTSVKGDECLMNVLRPYDGVTMRKPVSFSPSSNHSKRRLELPGSNRVTAHLPER